MSPRDDSLRLADMLAAAREARTFARGRAEVDLSQDRQLTLALLKCVEIVGEAAARVGEDTRLKYPELPWDDMVGMRNRLVHTYFDLDLSVLWTTVSGDLPELIRILEGILGPKSAR
jgi:uncharacterized protein with HEPN domain